MVVVMSKGPARSRGGSRCVRIVHHSRGRRAALRKAARPDPCSTGNQGHDAAHTATATALHLSAVNLSQEQAQTQSDHGSEAW